LKHLCNCINYAPYKKKPQKIRT